MQEGSGVKDPSRRVKASRTPDMHDAYPYLFMVPRLQPPPTRGSGPCIIGARSADDIIIILLPVYYHYTIISREAPVAAPARVRTVGGRERASSPALIPGAVLARPRRPHLPPPLSHTHSVGRSTGRALPPAAAAGA